VNYITRAVFQIPDLSTIGEDFGKTWITVNFIRDDAGLRFITSKTSEPVISLPSWDLSSSPLPVSAPAHFALVDSGASIHILLCHTFLTARLSFLMPHASCLASAKH